MNANSEATKFSAADLEGFDPLADKSPPETAMKEIFEQAIKGEVLNILRSYTGTLDCFSEGLQNAIDAIEKRASEGSDFEPQLWILIDTKNSIVRITDNGVGMSLPEFMYCLRPSVSFKRLDGVRGHKGVGATFLAYGFQYLRLQTKRPEGQHSVILRNGRRWVDDDSGRITKPVFEVEEFNCPELASQDSGTSVEIGIEQGGAGQGGAQRPNFSWLGMYDPEQWLKVLRLKTPLGGVYLEMPKVIPAVTIEVIDQDGKRNQTKSEYNDFLYPHECDSVKKIKDIDEIKDKWSKLKGDKKEKIDKISAPFKRLDCIWQLWPKDKILSEEWGFASELDESQRQLVERHNVFVYGCFIRSRTVWGNIQKNELKVRPQFKVIEGGLQLATDFMVQGDLRTIPLTTAAGYAANAFIIVHFRGGNPDMGRKVFQPELQELADVLSRRAVAEFRKWHFLLKSDTGAPSPDPSLELHDWKIAQEQHAASHPITLTIEGKTVAAISEPRAEQDVIVLFHELVGQNVIKGLKFLSTESHEKYDGIFRYDYDNESLYFNEENAPLGIKTSWELPKRSAPLVLEYKYDLDGLIRDFATEVKRPWDIDLVVCWSVGNAYKLNYYLQPYLLDQEGSNRLIYGSTHALCLGEGQQPICAVIVLQDLINYLINPNEEVARQKTVYLED